MWLLKKSVAKIENYFGEKEEACNNKNFSYEIRLKFIIIKPSYAKETVIKTKSILLMIINNVFIG